MLDFLEDLCMAFGVALTGLVIFEALLHVSQSYLGAFGMLTSGCQEYPFLSHPRFTDTAYGTYTYAPSSVPSIGTFKSCKYSLEARQVEVALKSIVGLW